MPSLLRPASGLLLGALALVLVVCWPALAGAPGGIEITVKRPDDKTKTVLASEVKPDINGPYTVREVNGTTSQIDVVDGVSIRELLVSTQSELGYVTLELPGPGGRAIKLTRAQIDAAVPRPPVLYSDETGATWFLRSPTSSTDVNAADHFKIASSAITLTQADDELKVAIKASRKRIEPGESVRFEATAKPAGANYRYNWTFEPGVGERDAQRTVTHRFKKAGSYNVVVGVYIGDDEASSGSASVKIQVGDPKESDKDREGGGDNTATGAPDSGASTGSSGAGPVYDGSSSSTPMPYTPSSPVTPSTPTPSTPDPAPDVATSGTPVTGNLLADASDPPPSNILESAARAARDGNQKDDAGEGGGVPEAALSIAGVLALLGLGAGIENRQGRLPRPRLRLPLPRRAA